MGILKNIANLALKPSVVVGNAISNVIKKGSGKTTSAQLANTTAGKFLGLAIAGTAVGLVAATGAGGTIARAAKAKPIAAGVSGLAGYTILKSERATEQVADLPSNVNQFTTNIAEFADNPSIEKAKDIATENPVLTTLAGAGGLAGLGIGLGGIAGTLSNIQNTRAVKENTEATLGGNPDIPAFTYLPAESGVPASPTLTDGMPPTLETVDITQKKRRRARAKAPSQNISQNVRINILNKTSSTKRYINAIAV